MRLTPFIKPFIIQAVNDLHPAPGIQLIIDRIIRSRRKTIALIVQPDGKLIVRAPLRASPAAIRSLVEQKAGWIITKQRLAKSTYSPLVPKRYVRGEGFWYLGSIYPLEIVNAAPPPLTLDGTFRLAKSALPKAQLIFERWYKQQALDILTQTVQRRASQNGFHYASIRITSARTRWGSCSPRGTLSFTWRLIMAPLPVIDYVVVHELVHLEVKNHSKKFWAKVKSLLPDYSRFAILGPESNVFVSLEEGYKSPGIRRLAVHNKYFWCFDL